MVAVLMVMVAVMVPAGVKVMVMVAVVLTADSLPLQREGCMGSKSIFFLAFLASPYHTFLLFWCVGEMGVKNKKSF